MIQGLKDLYKFKKEVEISDQNNTSIKLIVQTMSDGDKNEAIIESQKHETEFVKHLEDTRFKEESIKEAEDYDDDKELIEILVMLRARRSSKDTKEITKIVKENLKTDRKKTLEQYASDRVDLAVLQERLSSYKLYVVKNCVRDPETGEKLFSSLDEVKELDSKLIEFLYDEYSNLEPSTEELKNSQPPTNS